MKTISFRFLRDVLGKGPKCGLRILIFFSADFLWYRHGIQQDIYFCTYFLLLGMQYVSHILFSLFMT